MNRYFITLIALLVCTYNVFAQFTTGDGSKENPYHIATADQLNSVRNYLDKHFILTADIDLSVSPYSAATGWVPIGDAREKFSGSFDGRGNTISGMVINASKSYLGLFGYVSKAIIKNVALKNCSVKGRSQAGILAGLVADTSIISACYSTGSVEANSEQGGLIGALNRSYVINCYSEASSKCTGGNTGGLIGWNNRGVVQKCFSTGLVTGYDPTGGLIAVNDGKVLSSYYNRRTTQQSDTGKGVPLPGKELKVESSFVSWDFDSIWKIEDKHPQFRYDLIVDSLKNDIYTAIESNSTPFNAEGYSLTVAPTPTKSSASLYVESEIEGVAIFQIYRSNSQIIMSKKRKLASNKNSVISLPEISKLRSGIYYIKMIIEGEVVAISKLVKID